MAKELDNKKMWESLLKRFQHIKDRTFFNIINWSLKEQGLQYNPETKSIEEIPGTKKDVCKGCINCEMSEEDERMLNLIIARLHSHPNIDLEEYSKEYDWLNLLYENLKAL